jgi:fatty-acyl-CoA synthase
VAARTLPQLLERAAEHDPERLALVMPEPAGERRMSYGQLAADSARLAVGLARLGLRRGDRILVWLPNLPEWFVAQFAAARLGLTVVAVNTRYRGSEIAGIERASNARAVVLAEGFLGIEFLSMAEEASHHTRLEYVIDVAAEGWALSFAGQLADGPSPSQAWPGDIAAVFCTSGTTAAPRLAAHDQQSIVEHARNVAAATGMRPGDALLLALPAAGVFGFSGAMAALAAGATLVLQPVFDAGVALTLLERYHITHFYGPDAMLQAVLEAAGGRHPGFALWRWGAFANFTTGQPQRLVARAEEQAGVRLHGTYGSSECFALMSTWPLEAPAATRARGGGYLVSPNMGVRCVAPGTCAPRPLGEPGELQFRGYNVLSRYLDHPEATAASMTADGWFRSGDLGQVQPDGAFVYLARLTDSLRLGGYLVDPQEVEEQLQAHPAVEIAQLVGVWREQKGDVPVAFVQLRPGARADEPDLLGFARHRMASYKVPRRVLFVHEFPSTDSANGRKIQKSRLREIAREQLEK